MSAISPTAHDLLKSDPFEHETIIAEGLSYEEFLRQFDGQHAEWFEGKPIFIHEYTQGRFFSTLLPFFAINPDVLWREHLPSSAEIMTLIQRMTAENGE